MRLRDSGDRSAAQKALDRLEKSCAGRKTCVSTAKVGRALDLGAIGQPAAALELARDALTVFVQTSNRRGEGRARACMGTLLLRKGANGEALVELEAAIPLLASAGDRMGEARAWSSLGNARSNLGKKRDALEAYDRALTILERLGDTRSAAKVRTNIGLTRSDLGENVVALTYLESALATLQEVGDLVNSAITLNNVAACQFALGRRREALASYERALAIYKKIEDPTGEAAVLLGMGNVWADLGDLDRALARYLEALSLQQQSDDPVGEAGTLINIGEVWRNKGDARKALTWFERALVVANPTGQPVLEAIALNNIADARASLGQQAEAIQVYERALAIARRIEDRDREAEMLTDMGITLVAIGDVEAARRSFEASLEISRSTGNRASEAETLYRMARMYRSTSLDLAILKGKEAVNAYQSLRADAKGVGIEGERAYARSISGAYRFLADALVDAGRLLEAQDVLDLLKEDELRRMLRRTDPGNGEIKYTASERSYRELVDGLLRAEAEAATLRQAKDRTPDQASRLATLEVEIGKGQAARDAWLAGLAAGQDQLARERERQGAEFGSVAHHFKNLPDAVAVYTVTERDWVTLIVFGGAEGRKHRARFKIPIVELARRVAELRNAARDPGVDPRPAASAMWDVLVGPIDAHLAACGAKTILWSLDGLLRYVPVAALWDPHRSEWLAERYRSVLITTATFNRLSEPTSTSWQVSAFGMSRETGTLPALRFVPVELDAVVQGPDSPKGALPGSRIADEGFTLQALDREIARKPSVVHVATHYVFDSTGGDSDDGDAGSYLLLGKGRLTLRSIDDWPFTKLDGIELVTFSACDTAMSVESRELAGAEVHGLAMVAQQKGAAAVLATLWSVNDPATAAFMAEFYRARQAAGLSKAEALRSTQAAFAAGRFSPAGDGPVRGLTRPASSQPVGWSHPFYWAPFILVGNPR